MKQSFNHGNEACIVSIPHSAVCCAEVACHLNWCSRFCSCCVGAEEPSRSWPISGGNPSQDSQILSLRSTSPPMSRTLSQVFGRFVLTPLLGCHGQILGHWKMQLEMFCQDRNKTQKLCNAHGSIHFSIFLESPYSPLAAKTASVHPSLPSSPAAMDALP